MKEFIYDDTFEGLLTALFYAYSCNEDCAITSNKHYTPNMLAEKIYINTEIDKFHRVYKSIENNLNNFVLYKIYYLYLCNMIDSKTLALKYLRLCYKHGTKINLAKNNDIILKVDKYTKQVSLEAHRFIGFVRFKEISPLNFYSSIQPDNNILPLILKHFTTRFSDQNFIIHDIKREIAILYNKKSSIISPLSQKDVYLFSSVHMDNNFESLWKTFYKSINIKERENLKLRNQYMPKRYWNELSELKD